MCGMRSNTPLVMSTTFSYYCLDFTSHSLLATLHCRMCVRSCATSSFANISSWQSTFDDKCGSMWFVCLRFCNLSFRCRQIRSSSVLFHRVSALVQFFFLWHSVLRLQCVYCVSARDNDVERTRCIVPFLEWTFFSSLCVYVSSLLLLPSARCSLLFFYLPSDYL